MLFITFCGIYRERVKVLRQKKKTNSTTGLVLKRRGRKEDVMRLIVVTLVSFVLAFSANAQPLNIDPEVRSTSAMSESSARLPRMARAPQMEPTLWTPWEAAVVVRSSGQVGTNDIFSVSCHIFTPLPKWAMTESWIRKPDGEVYLPSVLREDITVPDLSGWQWWIWNEPLPADWPAGVTTFELIVTIGWGTPDERKYTAVARVATGGVYPAGDPPRFGPLEDAIVDSSGGVILRGVFNTPPVVVAPDWVVRKIELEGDYYVPPGSIGAGNRPLGVCSGVNGDPNHLECSTQIVSIPVF
ncbi:MAG: hypothetical protein WA060_01490 [Minisyncoccia bacterium]